MTSAVRTACITFPQKDVEMLQRITSGMGWVLHLDSIQDDAVDEEKLKRAEEMAHRIAYSTDDFEELKAHDFYVKNAPQCMTFADVESEIAYLDAADKEGYVCEDEVEHLRNLWKVFD